MFPAVEELAGFSAPEGLDEALQGCYTFLRGEWLAWPTMSVLTQRAAAVGMQGELAGGDIMLDDGVVEHGFEQRGAFSVGDLPVNAVRFLGLSSSLSLDERRGPSREKSCLSNIWRSRLQSNGSQNNFPPSIHGRLSRYIIWCGRGQLI